MRAVVLLIALTMGGCLCWERERACVQEYSRCHDFSVVECAHHDDLRDAQPVFRECHTTLRHESCGDLGYTVSCGEYAVRPGDGCF